MRYLIDNQDTKKHTHTHTHTQIKTIHTTNKYLRTLITTTAGFRRPLAVYKVYIVIDTQYTYIYIWFIHHHHLNIHHHIRVRSPWRIRKFQVWIFHLVRPETSWLASPRWRNRRSTSKVRFFFTLCEQIVCVCECFVSVVCVCVCVCGVFKSWSSLSM